MNRYAVFNAQGQWLFDFNCADEDAALVLEEAKTHNPEAASIRLVQLNAVDKAV